MMKRFCNENCCECPLMQGNGATRELALILNKLVILGDDEIAQAINEECPNLTCCPDCHIDDFCHVEGCEIHKEVYDWWNKKLENEDKED